MPCPRWHTVLLLCNPTRSSIPWQQQHLCRHSTAVSVGHPGSGSGVTNSTSSSSSSSDNASSSPSCAVYEDVGISPQDLPLPVWEALQQLRAAGHNVLLVGGAVRDLLLCRPPRDYDVLTSARLQQVKQLFHRPRIVGRLHPICQVDLPGGTRLEISSMHSRKPALQWGSSSSSSQGAGAILPPDAADILQAGPAAAVAAAVAAAAGSSAGAVGRHGRFRAAAAAARQSPHPPPLPQHQQPQQQQLSWAAARRANARGRDFSVNGLLYDPFLQLVFDYVGGLADARHQVLRVIGDPAARFTLDPVCLLRAVRCAARAGLVVEPAALAAMQQHSQLVLSLNSQRLTAELLALLAHGAAAPSLQLLQQAQLLQHVLPLHHAHLKRHQLGARSASSSRSQAGGSNMPALASQQDREQHGGGAHQPAASALGQLLGGLGGPHLEQQPGDSSQLAAAPAHTSELQQQPGCVAPLVRVLAALDQHVSVQQPASPAVVLACLTAPLLLDALRDALQQLQAHEQAAALLAAEHELLQQQQLQPQLQSQLHQQQQQQQRSSLGAAEELQQALWGSLGGCEQLARLQLVAAHSAARNFSSTSASTSTSSTDAAARPDAAGVPAGQQPHPRQQQQQQPRPLSEAARLLLEGMPFVQVAQQQAAALATQVCSRPQHQQQQQQQQHAWPAGMLFGSHAPQLAAALIHEHLLHSPPQHGQQRGSVQHNHVGSASSSSSSSDCATSTGQTAGSGCRAAAASSSAACEDDYALFLPRTNKHYKQLMERQWGGQLQGGHIGSLGAQQAMLLEAAADADEDNGPDDMEAGALGGGNGGRSGALGCSRSGRGGAADAMLLCRVLAAAGGELHSLQQALGQAVSRLQAGPGTGGLD